ncbi:MAG: hypothetical protein FJW90_03875 [Actinobacteria bacterium]|nr:hypothetical protein [Actinomycetota bacterium]
MPIAELSSGTVLILIVIAALPIGAVVFALGAGRAFSQIGRGEMSIGDEEPRPATGIGLTDSGMGAQGDGASAEVREEEIRQMVQARSDRAVARGEQGFDVDAEVERLLEPAPGAATGDRELREEVRQLVVARNERRLRQGKEPLGVEAEVERQLRDLEGLGQ